MVNTLAVPIKIRVVAGCANRLAMYPAQRILFARGNRALHARHCTAEDIYGATLSVFMDCWTIIWDKINDI